MRRRTRRLMLAGAAASLASLVLAGGAMASQPSSSGMFVIGDQNVTPGSQVTFWGAQWWTDDTLSADVAPAAFKGYADNVTGNCGDGWSTDTGNSSGPPASLPSTISVIVSSQITQNGSVISGDTTEIATVQVDPGYAGNPGHAGTGTVIAVTPCGGGGGVPIS